MISVLTRIFGSHNLILVEDIVQDTLTEAISNWTYHGIPKNHVGWLYTVAKNKTLNALRREKHKEKYISENLNTIKKYSENDLTTLFLEDTILDDQLRMMFTCCHPDISADSQIALILKTLCGFSVKEIAKAFLTNYENINKRLVRARKTIRDAKIAFEVPSKSELAERLNAVLEVIYLMFNEGYNASSGNELIRKELCEEAIRLAEILVKHKLITAKSDVYALLGLMQLNKSRFSARQDKYGNILTLNEQDRSLWNFHIMEQGFSNLRLATQDKLISEYHILACISAYHCAAKNIESTNWEGILGLYKRLLIMDNSAIVVLNHAIALSKTGETKKALEQLNSIENNKVIKSNYLFYCTKAEFQIELNNPEHAKETLKKAIKMAPLSKEKELLRSRFSKYFEIKNDTDVPIF